MSQFLENDFVIMVFHYDGVVDQWDDLQWANRVIHVSAVNQTKWYNFLPQIFCNLISMIECVFMLFYLWQCNRWFAKRFLHPDIVAEYDYVFLWDEDLDIENFDPGR